MPISSYREGLSHEMNFYPCYNYPILASYPIKSQTNQTDTALGMCAACESRLVPRLSALKQCHYNVATYTCNHDVESHQNIYKLGLDMRLGDNCQVSYSPVPDLINTCITASDKSWGAGLGTRLTTCSLVLILVTRLLYRGAHKM